MKTEILIDSADGARANRGRGAHNRPRAAHTLLTMGAYVAARGHSGVDRDGPTRSASATPADGASLTGGER
jgi:hypothetical protein